MAAPGVGSRWFLVVPLGVAGLLAIPPAAMSTPFSTRTVALTPCARSARSKASTRVRRERGVAGFEVGLTGMRLTWHDRPRSLAANARACSGESFTPSTSAYSMLNRRPVVVAHSCAAASISAMVECVVGTRERRRSSSGACNDSASPTCSPSVASRRIAGTSPTVESVM